MIKTLYKYKNKMYFHFKLCIFINLIFCGLLIFLIIIFAKNYFNFKSSCVNWIIGINSVLLSWKILSIIYSIDLYWALKRKTKYEEEIELLLCIFASKKIHKMYFPQSKFGPYTLFDNFDSKKTITGKISMRVASIDWSIAIIISLPSILIYIDLKILPNPLRRKIKNEAIINKDCDQTESKLIN